MENPENFVPTSIGEVTRDVKEHEVFFSFNSDHHAEAFEDWWYSEGQSQFVEYVRNRLPGVT